MKLNNKVWIVIGIVVLTLFALNPAKKEAGETIIKFRTSSLEYPPDGTIAFNINCAGDSLIQYTHSGAVGLPTGRTCETQYGTPIFDDTIIGTVRTGCSTPPKLYVENAAFNRVVACCNRDGTGAGRIYSPTANTESPLSIDSSREINCAIQPIPPPPNQYNLFIDAKTNYVNGGALPEFVTKANEWILSPT